MSLPLTASPSRLPPFDALAAVHRADPYSEFERYREHDPVHRAGAGPTGSVWYVFSYEAVVQALKDGRFGRVAGQFLPPGPLGQMFSQWMVFKNPPDHTRLRSLVNAAFTPKRVAALRPRIEELCDWMLTSMAEREEADLIRDLASTLPVMVVAETLGVPPEDRRQFRTWADTLRPVLEIAYTRRQLADASLACQEICSYLEAAIAERRVQPRDDLLTALIEAEDRGDRLGPSELVPMCVFLLTAGHETVTNLIGNGMWILQQDRRRYQQLQDHPELIPAAVEEIVRLESPVQIVFREPLEAAELGGRSITVGDQVGLMIGAANRDPKVFQRPDVYAPEDRKRNRHLAFGYGAHYCLGAPLARLQGEIVFRRLVTRFPNLRLKLEGLQPRPWRGVLFRGLRQLPLALEG